MKTNESPQLTEPVSTHVVWDALVRVFHWSLVVCVALNAFILEEGETAHQWTGYVATGLVGLRILWGFVSRGHARFSEFFPTPTRVRQHLRQVMLGTPHAPTLGHNPLGGLMMLTLMGLVLSLGLTGYLMGTDALDGEEWLEELHEFLANTLYLAAVVHVMAAWVMGKIERVNLIKAMITGRKTFH